MKWLINYIRSCFCKHEWECIASNIAVYDSDFDRLPLYHKNIYVCKKCMVKKTISTK